MRTRLLALTGLLFVLAGCDLFGGDPSIGGLYTGTLLDAGDTISYTFDFPETDGGSFSWTAEGVEGGFDFEFEGTGSYNHPDITLTVDEDGEDDIVDGTVSDDGDVITLTIDDGDDEDTLVLRRND